MEGVETLAKLPFGPEGKSRSARNCQGDSAHPFTSTLKSPVEGSCPRDGDRAVIAVIVEKCRRSPGSGSDAKDLGLILGVVNEFKTHSRKMLPPVQ